jgi:hypothetical protein
VSGDFELPAGLRTSGKLLAGVPQMWNVWILFGEWSMLG